MQKSVLIIDDSQYGREVIQAALNSDNYNVISALNCIEGLKKSQQYLPDFIIINSKTFDPDELDAYKILRSKSDTAEIPVIFLVSKDEPEIKEKIRKSDKVEYLEKSLDKSGFLKRFKNISAKYGKSDETGKGIDILVAEDDMVTRHIEEFLLKKNGYKNIRLAVDGKEAFELFLEKTPDLLILDYMMPHKTGFEVLQEIRKNIDYDHIPIIFLTAVNDKSKLIEALNAGATDYITKPFDQAELLARVDAHARNYYLQKELRQTNKRLALLNKELCKKNAQIEADLRSARKIQEALLPRSLIGFDNLDINYFYQASNSVGGDYINIFQLEEQKIGLCIADVSGHGVTSALIAVFTREQLNNILKQHKVRPLTPAEILRQLNKSFNDETYFIENGLYVTIFVGILDLQTYKLTYASAGHHALPLIVDHQKNITELTELGVAIGFLDDFPYEDHEIQLDNNQKIFLHTDGIIEMENSKHELFGMDRVKEFLKDNYNLMGKDLMTSLVNDALCFSDEKVPQDDIALILLEKK